MKSKTITLTIDRNVLSRYNEYYFSIHPRATKEPIKAPYHESINVWMIMKRPMMNALKQKWKNFIEWFNNKFLGRKFAKGMTSDGKFTNKLRASLNLASMHCYLAMFGVPFKDIVEYTTSTLFTDLYELTDFRKQILLRKFPNF